MVRRLTLGVLGMVQTMLSSAQDCSPLAQVWLPSTHVKVTGTHLWRLNETSEDEIRMEHFPPCHFQFIESPRPGLMRNRTLRIAIQVFGQIGK
jgi:hypothetical protein